MKVSLISTIYNEEKSIESFLKSIEEQVKTPDEIIIVDGGSTDKTLKIVNNYKNNTKIPIRLIIKHGANISQGRNIAIKNAKYDIIASTDAGSKLDKFWLKKITDPFKKPEVNAVMGGFKLIATNSFQRALVIITSYKHPERNLPSSRSIAFRKWVWDKVAKYPENLKVHEDTHFNCNLKKGGIKFFLRWDAKVYWEPRQNFKEVFKQYFKYFYWWGRSKDSLGIRNKIIFSLYFILIFLFLMSLIYKSLYILLFSICLLITYFSLFMINRLYKNKELKSLGTIKINDILYSLITILIINIAQIIGFCGGKMNIKKWEKI